MWAFGHYQLRLGADWWDEYTFYEFDALCKMYGRSRDERFLCASIVATTIANVNRGKDDKPIPIDTFVPRDEAARESNAAEMMLQKAQLLQAKLAAQFANVNNS